MSSPISRIQPSEAVAVAQVVEALNELATSFVAALAKYTPSAAIAKTGLKFPRDEATGDLYAWVHERRYDLRYLHVWDASANPNKLAGCIALSSATKDEARSAVLQIVFDRLGNARIVGTGGALHSLTDEAFLPELARQLIAAVQSTLPQVPE